MVKQLIGITGLAGSGKDSICDIIVKNELNWKKMSFASHLKDVTALLFGWDRTMLAGETTESRFQREVPDEFWSNKLGKPFTPRNALQFLGTNLLRNQFYQDIWVACLEKKILESDKNVAISDVRFPNEIKMIRRLGGKIWRIEKEELPSWYKKTESWNKDNESGNLKYDIPYYVPELNNIHESEWRWIGLDNPEHIFIKRPNLELLEKDVMNYLKNA